MVGVLVAWIGGGKNGAIVGGVLGIVVGVGIDGWKSGGGRAEVVAIDAGVFLAWIGDWKFGRRG